MRMPKAVLALSLVAVLAVVGALAVTLTNQARLAALDEFCRDEPQSSVCGGTTISVSLLPSSSPGASESSGAPSASPSPGDPRVGGAVWLPPQVDEAASIVIAAPNSAPTGTARADIVVSGTADDEINAALAQLGSTGGGQVTLLEGRYELAGPVVIDGDGLALVGVNVGNGAGYAEEALGSQLVPADSFPAGEFLVRGTPEAYGALISLVHLDGLDRAQGMNIEGKRPTISLNAVTQSADVGMRFAGESTGNRPYDGFVLFNRVFDGGGIGILHDQRSGDMLIEGNVVFRNAGDGFRCFGASQMYRVNHAYENDGVGLRIIPGCVRTRLSSNKWEGNALGGVSIEGGSGFTIVGDTFAHNEEGADGAEAHLQLGVRGDAPTSGVLIWGVSFGKGDDDNPYLVHVGSRASDVHLGPMFSAGGYTDRPVLVDAGGEVEFYTSVPDPVAE
jgi:hypothetical protein